MNGTLTPRQSFRDLLGQVAQQAKALLPQAVNGRIESAVKMVLAGDVFCQDDGTITVGSRSNPAVTYTLQGTTCTCVDFGTKAPQGWCAHRIAANLQRSVERVLARRQEPAPPIPMDPDWVEAWPDNDVGLEPDQAYPDKVAPPAAPALPEAPASINVRLTIGGRECQLTLRDVDEDKLLARLEAVLARYPQPQAPPQPLSPQQHGAAQVHRKVVDFCPVYGVAMKQNQKEGRTWWSHYDEAAGRWCKGR